MTEESTSRSVHPCFVLTISDEAWDRLSDREHHARYGLLVLPGCEFDVIVQREGE